MMCQYVNFTFLTLVVDALHADVAAEVVHIILLSCI